MIPIDMLKREVPKPYIDMALSLIDHNHDLDVFEVGCMRQPLKHPINETHHFCCLDGHSSYIFASNGLKTLSIDIDPIHLSVAKDACKIYSNITFALIDAFQFTKEIDRKKNA